MLHPNFRVSKSIQQSKLVLPNSFAEFLLRRARLTDGPL